MKKNEPVQQAKASGKAKRHNKSGRGHRADPGDKGYGVCKVERNVQRTT